MQKIKFTILGASGFIGSELKHYLYNKYAKKIKQNLVEIYTPTRQEIQELLFSNNDNNKQNLGIVFYCIGMTADFRTKPFDTIDAHVLILKSILKNFVFDKLIYLSSTRVYLGADSTNEFSNLIANSNNFDDLYNISKLMGESLCNVINKNLKNNNIKIVRLSNVLGNDYNSNNFVFSIIKSAINNKIIRLQTNLLSAKDYVFIDDVCDLIFKISLYGKNFIYNIASGFNLTNKDIVDLIISKINAKLDGYSDKLPIITFPNIDITKIQEEFSYNPDIQSIKNKLSNIIHLAQQYYD